MSKKISLFFFGCMVALTSFQKTEEENKILWTPARKLSWTDFKAKPDVHSSMAAMSDCGISTNAQTSHDSLLFIIDSYFTTTSSWVKSANKTDTLLKHEQGHFDINEIYTRKLRKQLKKQKFFLKTVKAMQQDIVAKNFRLLEKEQNKYDSETKHSKNRIKQAEWDKKIADELKNLEMYTTSTVRVRCY